MQIRQENTYMLQRDNEYRNMLIQGRSLWQKYTQCVERRKRRRTITQGDRRVRQSYRRIRTNTTRSLDYADATDSSRRKSRPES